MLNTGRYGKGVITVLYRGRGDILRQRRHKEAAAYRGSGMDGMSLCSLKSGVLVAFCVVRKVSIIFDNLELFHFAIKNVIVCIICNEQYLLSFTQSYRTTFVSVNEHE